MADKVRFSFLLRPNEVTALKRIAEVMDRSQGAALRTLIRERARELERVAEWTPTPQPQRAGEVSHDAAR